jgi:hypothetical protein
MKQITFILLILFTGQSSQGQELPAKYFYTHLGNIISTTQPDSITLIVTEYGCLGSQINSSAKIKNKGNVIEVDFYYQRPKDRTKISSEYETLLDTSYTVEKSVFKNNLKAEINSIETRPIFIEASFKIALIQGNSNEEFRFRRGEGLYYLLRFNRTWESRFNRK